MSNESNFVSGKVSQAEGEVRYEDAAEHVTVSGYSCKTCHRFYGEHEEGAKRCCATSFPCENKDCTNRAERHNRFCSKCWLDYRHENWLKKSAEPIDWRCPLVYNEDDEYFFDEDSLIEYCLDHEVLPSDLDLLHTVPHVARRFNLLEFVSDDLFEDDNPYDMNDVEVAEKVVNDLLQSAGTLCWYPDHKRRPTDEDIRLLDEEVVKEMEKDQ